MAEDPKTQDESPSTEDRLGDDGVKEILAPSEGPREHLVSTAVKFLQNPKVSASPLYQKKAFLEKKGLTQEEINLAVQRSGVKENSNEGSNMNQTNGLPPGHPPGNLAQLPPPPPVYAPIPPESMWAKVRNVAMTTMVVASVSYGMYHFFQNFLRPWLVGKSAQDKQIEMLERQVAEIQESVVNTLADIKSTLCNLQGTVTNQQLQSVPAPTDMRGISDLKTDIASLKKLLLSRDQFPPAPSASPILPAWQQAQTNSSPSALMSESTKDVNSLSIPTETTPNSSESDMLNGYASEPIPNHSSVLGKVEASEENEKESDVLDSQEASVSS